MFIKGQPVDEYIQYLLEEIKLTLQTYPTSQTETIYVGGGTPTALSAQQLDKLLGGIRQLLPFEEGNEFTVEANPGDLTLDKLQVMATHGVNRLSMGVQTFDDRLLKKIGRKHTEADVFETMKVIEKSPIDNVSIDLIYALPGQSLASFTDTLEKAIGLDLPHYSLYSLILENKTVFANWARQGRLHLPGEDLEGDMFEQTIKFMEEHGRRQYEVSNFSLPHKESQHNLVYWNNDHYFGFGAGASGYLGHTRYRNHGPIQHYLTPLKEGKLPTIEKESLTKENQMEEEMFLGLRKKQGVSKTHFEEKFSVSMEQVYGQVIKDCLAQDLLKESNDYLSLTEQGLIVGNEVFQQFLLDKKNNDV